MTQLQSRTCAIALWLLTRLGPGNANESLAGDLAEEHHRGRSALWLATQVFAAIAIGAFQMIRTHKSAAASGVVTGLASLWCLLGLVTLLLARVGFPHAVHWRRPHGFALLAIGFASAVVSGWIVGRMHRAHRPAAVFSFLISVLILPMLELPLLYWFAPGVFVVTVIPMLPMALVATAIGAPIAILTGGFWGPSRTQSPQATPRQRG